MTIPESTDFHFRYHRIRTVFTLKDNFGLKENFLIYREKRNVAHSAIQNFYILYQPKILFSLIHDLGHLFPILVKDSPSVESNWLDILKKNSSRKLHRCFWHGKLNRNFEMNLNVCLKRWIFKKWPCVRRIRWNWHSKEISTTYRIIASLPIPSFLREESCTMVWYFIAGIFSSKWKLGNILLAKISLFDLMAHYVKLKEKNL